MKRVIEPDTNIIDIWQVDLQDVTLDGHLKVLSEDERIRVDKFVFPNDKKSFARSRCALRLILAEYLVSLPEKLLFHYGEHGKPVLAENDSVDFNISHYENIALVAVTRGRPLGVDINRVGGRTDRSPTDWKPIAKRSFSPGEQQEFEILPPERQEETFYRIWTQKEAYTKAIGDGFSYGFQTFSVVVSAVGNTGLIADDNPSVNPADWHISQTGDYISQDDLYVAAIAYAGEPVEIRQRIFQCDPVT